MFHIDLKSIIKGFPPTKGSANSAGYDLAAVHDYEIPPGSICLISTGFSCAIPSNYAMLLLARSSLHKRGNGCFLANSVGLIDPDYRGEILIAVHNPSRPSSDYTQQTAYIRAGERIAQFILIPVAEVKLDEVFDLPSTQRAAGGFGSTGA